MNKAKYQKLKEAFEILSATKANVDLLASLKTVLAEATEADGTIKIVVERNKQVISIPATLLIDYIDSRKTQIETEVDTLLDKVEVA